MCIVHLAALFTLLGFGSVTLAAQHSDAAGAVLHASELVGTHEQHRNDSRISVSVTTNGAHLGRSPAARNRTLRAEGWEKPSGSRINYSLWNTKSREDLRSIRFRSLLSEHDGFTVVPPHLTSAELHSGAMLRASELAGTQEQHRNDSRIPASVTTNGAHLGRSPAAHNRTLRAEGFEKPSGSRINNSLLHAKSREDLGSGALRKGQLWDASGSVRRGLLGDPTSDEYSDSEASENLENLRDSEDPDLIKRSTEFCKARCEDHAVGCRHEGCKCAWYQTCNLRVPPYWQCQDVRPDAGFCSLSGRVLTATLIFLSPFGVITIFKIWDTFLADHPFSHTSWDLSHTS